MNKCSKSYREFNAMKFNLKIAVSNLRHRIVTFVSALLIATVIWQSTVSLAAASPLLATSANSISKQVTGRAEEIKGNAKQSIGKAQSAVEDKNRDIKMKLKDDLNEAKIAVDGGAARVKNSADKATSTVKDFFGK